MSLWDLEIGFAIICLLLHGEVYSPYIHTIILINKHAFGGNNIFKRRGN